jgi:two-component system, OmpR family, sensor histidine kinase VanS
LVFSRKIARPIEDLNRVAKEMNRMNFDVRYNGEVKGEVGELGTTLNHLTTTLKETILRLEEELAKEKNLKALRREFIARVSHELKTPIAVIKGYSEALEDGMYENEEEKAGYLTILQEESMKMDRMLREILDLSRLETRHIELKKETIEIKAYTEKIMKKLQAIDGNKRLRLMDHLEDPGTLVLGDPYRLEQILSNFIKNAMEHGRGNEVEVRLMETGKEKNSGKIRIEIKNQGLPFSKEEQAKVWESFYKREEKKGSGLGLSIAAGLLQLMQSSYGTYNETDGVVFYFSLEKLIK